VAALVFRELVSGESLSPNTNSEIGRYTMQVTQDGTIYLLDTREGLLLYGTRTFDFTKIDVKSELQGLGIDWMGERLTKLGRACDSLKSLGEPLPDTAFIKKAYRDLWSDLNNRVK
jgi:hypothetical protein